MSTFSEEKNDWVCCLEKALSDNRNSIESRNLFFKRGSVDFSFEGYLELMSPRIKVYTIISRDKVYLFKDCKVSLIVDVKCIGGKLF